jgi:hypothetical protein
MLPGALVNLGRRASVDPRPRVYYDARAVAAHPRFNMHAKCVVVGERS